jgi:hypothetical protein
MPGYGTRFLVACYTGVGAAGCAFMFYVSTRPVTIPDDWGAQVPGVFGAVATMAYMLAAWPWAVLPLLLLIAGLVYLRRSGRRWLAAWAVAVAAGAALDELGFAHRIPGVRGSWRGDDGDSGWRGTLGGPPCCGPAARLARPCQRTAPRIPAGLFGSGAHQVRRSGGGIGLALRHQGAAGSPLPAGYSPTWCARPGYSPPLGSLPMYSPARFSPTGYSSTGKSLIPRRNGMTPGSSRRVCLTSRSVP